jgi:hypothetical protein
MSSHRSNNGIVGSNPTRGMDVCLRSFCVCVFLYRQRPYDGLIPRLRSPTNCLYDLQFRVKSEWEVARGPNASKEGGREKK